MGFSIYPQDRYPRPTTTSMATLAKEVAERVRDVVHAFAPSSLWSEDQRGKALYMLQTSVRHVLAAIEAVDERRAELERRVAALEAKPPTPLYAACDGCGQKYPTPLWAPFCPRCAREREGQR